MAGIALRGQLAQLQDAVARGEKLRDEQRQLFQAGLAESRRQAIQQFQAIYIAPRPTVPARQQAAKRNRLIERYPAVRQKVHDEQLGRLVESLEVWLTRLDQADLRNATALAEFARQAEAEKLPARIEQALAGMGAPPEGGQADIAAWLLECELIFAGIGAG